MPRIPPHENTEFTHRSRPFGRRSAAWVAAGRNGARRADRGPRHVELVRVSATEQADEQAMEDGAECRRHGVGRGIVANGQAELRQRNRRSPGASAQPRQHTEPIAIAVQEARLESGVVDARIRSVVLGQSRSRVPARRPGT